MSSVILKENETLDRQPERENITNLAADLQAESSLISIRGLFLQDGRIQSD